MKKLMIAAAAMAAGVAIADVTSANIVGYNNITLNKEYTLMTLTFEKVSGGSMTINEAFPFCDAMTCAQANTGADNVQVMNAGGGYDIYFLSNGHYGFKGKNFNENITNKWVNIETTIDASTMPDTDQIRPGSGFWYLSRKATKDTPQTITVAGGVSLVEKESYDITKEYTLVGCPFPAPVAINGGIEVSDSTCAQANTGADNIQIMNTDGGYDIYFISNGHYGFKGKNFNENITNKWVNIETTIDASTMPDAATFPVGGGAWFLSRSKKGTLKFINPVK